VTAEFTSNDTAHCKTALASFSRISAGYASDTQNVNFNDTGVSTVDLSGDSGFYSHRIDFVNNSSTALVVQNIVLTNTSHFYIAQLVPGKPDTLQPGQKMGVIVHFYGDSSGTVYDDTLVATIDHALMAFYVYIKGHSPVIENSGVTETAPQAARTLHIYPNPSQGVAEILLDGAQPTTFEVLDVLGNVVAHHEGSDAWEWNAIGLPDGVYYIRATANGTENMGRILLSR
jgi:hypothetical protein